MFSAAEKEMPFSSQTFWEGVLGEEREKYEVAFRVWPERLNQIMFIDFFNQ